MLIYSLENITILAFLVFFIFLILKIINERAYSYNYKRILLGICIGVPALLLIIFNIGARQDIYFGIGITSIVLVTLYSGLLSSIFIPIIILIFHFCFFGVNVQSIIYVITYIIVTICSQLICKLEVKKINKFKCILFYSIIFSAVAFLILIQ